jgi:hypothetical protein
MVRPRVSQLAVGCLLLEVVHVLVPVHDERERTYDSQRKEKIVGA